MDIKDSKQENQNQALERFANIVGQSLNVDPAIVTLDSFLDDLGADSLDFLEITLETEEEFNINLPDRSIVDLVHRMCGPGVVFDEGVLTPKGRTFLLQKMPELNAQDLSAQVTVDEVNHLFCATRSWVRLITDLMQHAPTACPSCEGTSFSQAVVGRVKCADCGTEVSIPSGEEINRRWIEEHFKEELRAAPPEGLPAVASSAVTPHGPLVGEQD